MYYVINRFNDKKEKFYQELDAIAYINKRQAGTQYEYSILCDLSDNDALLKVIEELQDKLHRRNKTINNLRREIEELKEKIRLYQRFLETERLPQTDNIIARYNRFIESGLGKI